MKNLLTLLVCLVVSTFLGAQTSVLNQSKSFIKNLGQIVDQKGVLNSDVLFLFSDGNGMNTQLLKNGFSYDLYSKSMGDRTFEFNRIDIKFENCNPDVKIVASNSLPSVLNYYKGGESAVVSTNIPHYRAVKYENIYDKIDIIFKVVNGQIKYDIILHPGANINDIKFRYSGLEDFKLEDDVLDLTTSLRVLHESIPLSYCKESQKEKDVDFLVIEESSNSLLIGYQLKSPFNANKTLIIDPIPEYSWAKYVGDSLKTTTTGVITDRYGYVYICGATQSLNNMATSGAHQTTINDSISDAYVTKLNNGGGVVWSTYFGGELNDIAHDVYVDTSLNVFLAGTTNSLIGITDTLGHQDSLGGANDAFISKFNEQGQLKWSTYFGGTGSDEGTKLSTDYWQNVYLCGRTNSTNGIAEVGAFQSTLNGFEDGYVAKFDSLGAIQWSTYLGGLQDDYATGVAFGDTSVFICGQTYSNDFPITGAAHQNVLAGSTDGFLTKLSKDGDYEWSTYFGGQTDDNIQNVKVFNNNVYFIGTTTSDSSIASLSSFQPFKLDSSDAFIGKIDRDGALLWSTYLGGDSTDIGVDLFFELDSNLIVTGTTYSSDLPVDTNSYQVEIGGASDIFLSKITKDGAHIWTTYYGGEEVEMAEAVSVYGNTAIYTVGTTFSDSLLVDTSQVNSLNHFNSDYEGFVTKFKQSKSTLPVFDGNGGGSFVNNYVCPGEEILLTVYGGELGTDAEWVWYQGDCGDGVVFATGDSIYTTLYASTMFSVRAESITNSTECLSFMFHVAPSVPVTIQTDSLGCEGEELSFTASADANVNWSGPNGFTSNEFNPIIRPLLLAHTGMYYLTAVDSFGCHSSDSLNLVVNEAPIVDVSSTDVSCYGYNDGSIELEGEALINYTVNWFQYGTPNLNLNGGDTLNSLYAGSYGLLVIDSNNCIYQDSVVVSSPPSVLVDTLITPTNCTDSTGSIIVELDNQMGPYTVIWMPTNQAGDTAQFLGFGVHSVTIVGESKCTEEHSFFINNENDFDLEILNENLTFCAGTPTGSATVTGVNGTEPYTYDWVDLNVQNNSVSNLDSGIYIVHVYDADGCFAFDSVQIGAEHSIEIESIVSPATCSDSNGEISILIDHPVNYNISFSNGVVNEWMQYELNAGEYTATIVDTFGCEYELYYTIDLINDLEANVVPNDTILEMGTSTPLSVISNYDGNLFYTWLPSTNLDCSNCSNPVITPMDELIYEVIVTDSMGCVDTSIFSFIMTIPCIEVFVPTIFSPNNDGLNDDWKVIGTCINSVHIQVFNEWGELVFETEDQAVAWDGTFSGAQVQNDQYTYTIDVIYTDGTNENFAGFVTVAN